MQFSSHIARETGGKSINRSPAAARVVALARHERAVRAGEKMYDGRDFFGRARSPHRYALGHVVDLRAVN